jgi:hypothetical protein
MDTDGAVDESINASSIDIATSKDSGKEDSVPTTQKTELRGIIQQTAFALLCGLGEVCYARINSSWIYKTINSND